MSICYIFCEIFPITIQKYCWKISWYDYCLSIENNFYSPSVISLVFSFFDHLPEKSTLCFMDGLSHHPKKDVSRYSLYTHTKFTICGLNLWFIGYYEKKIIIIPDKTHPGLKVGLHFLVKLHYGNKTCVSNVFYAVYSDHLHVHLTYGQSFWDKVKKVVDKVNCIFPFFIFSIEIFLS